MNFIAVLAMLLLAKAATSSNEIQLNNTTSQIFFTKIGKLYSQVSYATMRIKVDLVPLKTENEKLCSMVKEIQHELRVQLMDCEAKEKPGYNMTTYDIFNLCDGSIPKSPFVDRPWKNRQLSKLIRALLEEMKHNCEENRLTLKEIEEIYHLDGTATNIGPNLDDSHSISKRQIVTALMVGVVTSLISTFTGHELFAMSQHDENLDVLEGNQDHIIQCLQDHETRLSRNEEHIQKLDDQIKRCRISS